MSRLNHRRLSSNLEAKLRGTIVSLVVAVILAAAFGSAAHAAEPANGRPSDAAQQFDAIATPQGVYRIPRGVKYAPDRLLVKFRSGVSATVQAAVRQSVASTGARELSLVPGLHVLRLPRNANVLAAAAELSRSSSVEYAVPDFAYQLTREPDDSGYPGQWALPKIGAPAAWDRSTGRRSVVVAVLDTGIDLDHPDLVANLVPGWNFVDGTDNPNDDQGHGTHVAGIIGGVGNNAQGVSGVNWSVSLMPLKICDANGSCYLSAEIEALEYAVAHGARVANASFGGAYGGWEPERDAIAAAGQAGLLFVAAAGNNAANNDTTAFYPAGYELDNIISVGASTPDDTLASFSNYGQQSVDLVAPGEGIISTVRDGYDAMSGTSMAAPHVTGAAALVRSLHPNWTTQKVRRQLMGTATPLSTFAGRAATCGRLNLDAATVPSSVIKSSMCVIRRGTGLGDVTSSPAGIDCGTTCGASFASDSTVTLTATPAAGATFGGWSGPCSGSATCVVTLTAAATVTATFNGPLSLGGWRNSVVRPPAGRDPFPPGSDSRQYTSFFNVALSADGKVRAKTIYSAPDSWCYYATSDTGGVFIERKTSAGWVADGHITAPDAAEPRYRWMNCGYFGTITELSADGSTLLVSQAASWVWPGVNVCVAYVYRRTTAGWVLEDTLYPPGVDAEGTTDPAACGYFGREGAISAAGDRIAIYSPVEDGGEWVRPRVDVFVRGTSGWAYERKILAPLGDGCGNSWEERRLAMSADGATILLGDPTCNSGGVGNAGRVHAYKRSGSQWTRFQTIASADAAAGRQFGESVAMSADGLTAVIGIRKPDAQPGFSRTAVIYELVAGKWSKRASLVPTAADPEASFSCTAVVIAGRRIVCSAYDTHGFNTAQGSIYVFNRPTAGWSTAAAPVRLFAPLGNAFERLGTSNHFWYPGPAVTENGKVIVAPVTALSLANGGHRDRIGYEFRR